MSRLTKTTSIFLFLFIKVSSYAQAETKDSLSDPNSIYYLTDVDLREVAKNMVNGTVRPMDNMVTFAILDSVSKGSAETRSFYVWAFDKILQKSDGALSEVIGAYCIESIQTNKNELLQWMHQGTIKTKPRVVASYIAYELEMSEQASKEKWALCSKILAETKGTKLEGFALNFVGLIDKEFDYLKE